MTICTSKSQKFPPAAGQFAFGNPPFGAPKSQKKSPAAGQFAFGNPPFGAPKSQKFPPAASQFPLHQTSIERVEPCVFIIFGK